MTSRISLTLYVAFFFGGGYDLYVRFDLYKSDVCFPLVWILLYLYVMNIFTKE